MRAATKFKLILPRLKNRRGSSAKVFAIASESNYKEALSGHLTRHHVKRREICWMRQRLGAALLKRHTRRLVRFQRQCACDLLTLTRIPHAVT
jgi:hypothetical protein